MKVAANREDQRRGRENNKIGSSEGAEERKRNWVRVLEGENERGKN
jgi:hypothetical protein